MKAVAHWNELLADGAAEYAAGVDAFRRRLVERGIRFGDRGLCNHLRPKFLSESQYADLARVSAAVLDGIMRAKERLLSDPDMLELVGVREEELPLISVDSGYDHIAPCVRLDSFMTERGPQFVELNGECPAGVAYGDGLASGFLEHPLGARFSREVDCRAVPTLPALLDTLLACWREWSVGTAKPRIAIVDYDHLPTTPEFELCREYFEREGYDAVVCDPRALEYDGETLTGGGGRIDLVYRRVLTNEFLDHYDDVKNLFLAYRDRKACVVNPFSAKVVHKKAVFALLTADDRREWLPAETVALLDRAVPWTRKLRSARATIDGREVDLVEYLSAHREEFVLKPNDDYGGKGITLGWEVDQSAWDASLHEAVDGDYVAQRRLHMVPESFPSMDDPFTPCELFVDLDPYIYLGKMVGVLARLGVGGLCNVTSGGGQVPVLVVADGDA